MGADGHERVAGEEKRGDVGRQLIRVLLNEAIGGVAHLAGVVVDGEDAPLLGLAYTAHRVLHPNLLEKLLVGPAVPQPALVVEPLQQTGHQLQPVGGRRECAVLHLHPLGREQPSLGGEDGLIKLLLQHLVDEVDQQLLKRVVLELFEAEDVQDANGVVQGVAAGARGGVDLRHNPVEQGGEDGLGEGVAAHLRRRGKRVGYAWGEWWDGWGDEDGLGLCVALLRREGRGGECGQGEMSSLTVLGMEARANWELFIRAA